MEGSKSTGQMATAKKTVQENTAMVTDAITQQDDAMMKIEDDADTPDAEDANTDTKLYPPDRDDDERSPTRRPYPIRDARMMTSCPSPSPQNIVTSGLTAANFATPPPPEKRGDNLLLQPPSTTSTELHSGLSIPSLLRFPSQPSQPGHDAAAMLSLNTPNLVNPNEAEQHMEEHIVIPRIRLAMRPSNRNNSPNHQHHDDDGTTGGAIDRREMTTTAGFVPIVQHDPREGGGGEEEDDE